MNNEYIISVLDFSTGQVDIFMTFLSEDEDHLVNQEAIDKAIEDRGHRMSDCQWMMTETNKFRLNIDI